MWITVPESQQSLEWYKRNIHQDYASLFLCVHDESDLLVDRTLMKPIMLKVSRISENKQLFDKVGLPYVNFYFDNEYDQWGSFTASGAFDPYKYEVSIVEQQNNIEPVTLKGKMAKMVVTRSEADVVYDEVAALPDGDVNLMLVIVSPDGTERKLVVTRKVDVSVFLGRVGFFWINDSGEKA